MGPTWAIANATKLNIIDKCTCLSFMVVDFNLQGPFPLSTHVARFIFELELFL
jgi:hypothetical protein